ncbi:MAG: hypothetical protein QOK48_2342 [Blastocatellia bacterium]|nr:hypothetical protein [Blastocatellia bacterium]
MKKSLPLVLVLLLLVFSTLYFGAPVAAQKEKQSQPPAPLMTRTTTGHDSRRLGFGGAVSIVGAPAGSITIEGWTRSEVEVNTEVELHAPSVAELDRLARINGFAIDEDANHIRILTTGTHDKKYLKRVAKDLPKSLIGLPWKVDYHIKVPAMTDLAIDAGNGPIKVSGVEGSIRINALESVTDLSLTGSDLSVLVQKGVVNFTIPARSWHGLRAEIRVASGNLNLDLMPGFSGDINAEVLRTGEIKTLFPNLEPRERNSIGPRSVKARAGSGGAVMTLTVGDGTIQIGSPGGKQ